MYIICKGKLLSSHSAVASPLQDPNPKLQPQYFLLVCGQIWDFAGWLYDYYFCFVLIFLSNISNTLGTDCNSFLCKKGQRKCQAFIFNHF